MPVPPLLQLTCPEPCVTGQPGIAAAGQGTGRLAVRQPRGGQTPVAEAGPMAAARSCACQAGSLARNGWSGPDRVRVRFEHDVLIPRFLIICSENRPGIPYAYGHSEL